MRKTSHDGGDSTSITSGFENETRKTSIIKTKRNSIKRKVQNFSHESDDTVIEPLLQIDKTETINRSAKYLLSKTKTDSLSERENKICNDNKFEKRIVLDTPVCSTGTTCISNTTIHNHMNTNVFGSHDGSKFVSTAKSPILVEIIGCKATGNLNQTTSIFTTAKIHSDSITKTMTPMQVTPLPILSSVERNTVKSGISPDNAQSKNTEPSTSSSNNLKSMNCYSRSDTGNSHPSTESSLKNISTMLDSRPIEISTKSDTKIVNKSYDTLKVIVTSVNNTKDTGIGSKVIQVPQKSSSNIILETKSKSPQEQHERLRDAETKIEITDNVSSANQHKSSFKAIVPKDVGAIKTEEKKLNSTSMKQLQRQKNTIVEDSRDTDKHHKNASEVDKFSISTHKDPQKGEASIIAEKKQCGVETPLTTSKDKVTQSTTLKADLVIANEAAITSKQTITPVTKNTSLLSNINKQIGSTSSVQASGSLPIKADLSKEKNNLENVKKLTEDNTSISVGSAKEIVSKPTVNIQLSHGNKKYKSDTLKEFKGSPCENQKSFPDNSSRPSNNKIISKSTVTVQPTQATAVFKSDFTSQFKKDHETGSSSVNKSVKESLSVSSKISKEQPAKPTTSVEPSISSAKLKSDTIKGKKIETDNITKDVGIKLSSITPLKTAVTTDSSEQIKINSTKILDTTPVEKNVTKEVHTTLSDKINVKTTTIAQPLKIDKLGTTSTQSNTTKALTTNSVILINTITVSKSDTTSKLPSSTGIPSCTNSVVVSSKNEINNRTTSTTSSLPSTSTTNSTIAKSSSSTKQSSKPKSTEKQGKI